MPTSSNNLDKWLKERLFNEIPMAIAVIDPAYNLVYANRSFERIFGEWKNRKCFSVYKSRDVICPYCKGAETFKDGVSRVNEEMGYDKNDNFIRYLKHTKPIVDENGNIPYLIEMSTDITESEQIRDEYQLLFDQVPCSILLIDRQFRIVKTNKTFREMVGEAEGKFCYESLKGLDHKCQECTARQTFEDEMLHTGYHIWKTKKGRMVHMHVITVPLKKADGAFDVVMEMAVDVTQTVKLKDGLMRAHNFLETIVSTSMDGIFAVNNKGKVTLFNPAARRFFRVKENQVVSRGELASMLPKGFLAKVSKGTVPVYLPETEVKTIDGDIRPVRLVGNQLLDGEKPIGMAFSVQDLRQIKQLGKEKLEAERLGAVGQTVAGLAHGVKNLITGLEGGMYMLNSGLSKSNVSRIQKGMDMLVRNIDRTSIFVKAFLSFSKGREIQVKLSDPVEIAKEVVELYSVKAKDLGITLTIRNADRIQPAPIDYESMHECLTNLVGNAIDACQMSEKGAGREVIVRIFEEGGAIFYEVSDDGCGMDYEVKKKVFTTFFTTKGLGGSGLGLLMTKKIVQEHGGQIDLTSEPEKGTTFRIRLPRNRLPKTIRNN
ncbi:PAS domain S-box protein [Thermodesulfobacteriota bacterium]